MLVTVAVTAAAVNLLWLPLWYCMACRIVELREQAERYCRLWHAAASRERAWVQLCARQTATIAALAARRQRACEPGRN